jgi:hypothetical protein
VPFERARTIDSLSAAIEDADITLSTEAPLTLALDRRVRRPRVGRVAATPRSHASSELVPQDRRPLFFDLVTESDQPWKTAARSLELCLDCWDRTGSLDTILEYPEFDTPAIRETVEVLAETASSYQSLAETRIDGDKHVYVIDEQSLTALDAGLLPDDGEYESISPFEDGEATFPEVHLYQSATAIVDAVVDQITTETAERIGVVLDQSTTYSPLLEAALEAERIPYQGGPGFIDSDDVRVFLRLLQTCFAGSTLTVAEVRPLLRAAGVDVPRTYDEQRVEVAAVETELPAFESLIELETAATTGSFKRALAVFEDLIGHRLRDLRDELSELELLDEPVTEGRVNELIYYFQSFEVPVERDSEGVLLTDAASTAYVDRPVVFYLGLGEGWAKQPPDYPWVDDAAFTERDIRRFKILMQNGQQRYVLAQPSRAGDEVTPCPYLREILDDDDFDSLADLPNATSHERTDTTRRTGSFPAPQNPPETEPVETISKSSLNTLTLSPRDFYFDRLVESPTNYYMKRGTVLHDAAEIFVNTPEWFTDDGQRDRLLEAMCDAVGAFVSDVRRSTIRSQFAIGLDVIEAYLNSHPPTGAEYGVYDEPDFDNDLADTLGITLESRICERWFSSPELGGHGIVDLLQDPQTIADYKSGSVKSPRDIQKKANIDDVHQTPDFQVLLYLAQHRRERPDEEIQMRFVHLLGMDAEMAKGTDPDLDELVSTLTYVPTTFSEFVASRAMFDQVTDYADTNNRVKVLSTLGYDRYREFFETHPLPREGEDPDRRAEIREAFRELAVAEVGDYKYVQSGVESIFGDLTEPDGYYLEDDVDAFEEFLAERLAELNEYRESRFPVSYDDEEPYWDRVDHRDCILMEDES